MQFLGQICNLTEPIGSLYNQSIEYIQTIKGHFSQLDLYVLH